jgi:CHAT domain-containing protein
MPQLPQSLMRSLMRFLITVLVTIGLLIMAHPLAHPLANPLSGQAIEPSNRLTGLYREAEQQLKNQQYQAAITTLEEILAITKTIPNQSVPDQSIEAETFSNLGIAYKNVGQYAKAIELQKQAGKIFLRLNNQSALGQTLLNLGNAYEAIGDYEKAESIYQASLGIAKTLNDAEATGIALNSLGGIAANLGENKAAIKYLESSLAIQQKVANPEAQAYVLLNLGSTYYFLQQFEAAAKNSEQALKIARSLQNPQLEAQSLTNLALIYADQGQVPRSLQLHQQAIAIGKTLTNPKLRSQLLNNYSHTLLETGQLVAAETNIRQSIQQLEQLRSALPYDIYKVSIFDTQRFSYSLLQQILIAENKIEAALEASEQSRSRALAEQLASQLSGQFGQSTAHRPVESTINLAQIRQIAQAQNATIVEYSIVTDDEFRFRGKQQGREERLLIWVIQPNGTITLRPVDLKSRWQTQGTLKQIVAAARCLSPLPDCPSVEELARDRAGAKRSKPITKVTPKLKTTAKERQTTISALSYPGLPELHDILIAPIADLLPTDPNDRVIFVPQDALFLVPFAALPDNQGEYLIQHHTIATVPSIQVLGLTARPQQQRWQSHQVIIAGNPSPMPDSLDPLPNAEIEAINIAQLFKAKPLIGANMTRSQLMRNLGKAKLIHLATHGLLDYGQTNSLDSPGAIALAASATDNGLLTAKDIARLKIVADLVVLSACDTGRGAITGDGVVGLARSWMSAGAANVLVSLWAVSDESTAFLMERFYQALQKQPNQAIALRQAMLETMKKYSGPYDWSAFTLIGS